MENYDVLKDVSERTGGDIYLGVVGPVRTGKSTFIKRFMEELVLPNIEDLHERERALDEMPQSGSGRTVMTAEPKFIPAEAVNIHVDDGIDIRVRLVDCVGYPVAGAMGFDDEDGPRMVDTPWSEEPMSFEQAAEIGTAKVINEHSTIGIVVLTDGSFGGLPAEAFNEAATRSIEELQALGKPFIILINSADPEGEAAQTMAEELAEQYGVTVIPLDLLQMDIDDITEILNSVLYEFPVTEVNVSLPRWIEELDNAHWLRREMEDGVAGAVQQVKKVRDISYIKEAMDELPDVAQTSLSQLALGQGTASFIVSPRDGLFFQVLEEYAGEEIAGEHSIISLIKRNAEGARRWSKVSSAMEEVNLDGYGVVSPQLDELYLEEPELIKQGGHFGVRLRASAPSYHMV